MLAVLLLAALNPGPSVSLRLLASRSPALPLGVWLAAGGAGGALLSGLATALAMREGGRSRRGSEDRATLEAREPWFGPTWPMGRGRAAAEPEGPEHPGVEPDSWSQTVGPERGPGEPPPTVSVPFRVLHRPQRSRSTTSGQATAPAAQRPAAATRAAEAASSQRQDADDWSSDAEEDW